MSSYDSMKTHGIVKTSLDITCSMRCCSIKIRNLNNNRFCTTLEVWSNWCYKDSELIFISRLNTDNITSCKHNWSDVKCSTTSKRRNPVFISLYNLFNSINESVFRELWHFKSCSTIKHTLSV